VKTLSLHEGEVERVRLCLVVTSDAVLRGEKRDEVTPIVEEMCRRCSIELVARQVVGNDFREIRSAVVNWVLRGCDVVLVSGGTGPSYRDVSIDAVKSLGGRYLPGFVELFRYLSFKNVGARAWLSRAEAYVVMKSLVIVLPGNPSAVRLALEQLICPVVRHLIYEIRRW